MQFKIKQNKIQVLIYAGYDNAKKRAKVKMVGSLDRFTYKPSDGLMDGLTIEQREEVQSYITASRQSDEQRVRQSGLYLLDSRIKEVADSLTDGHIVLESDSAAKLWDAIGLLSKALRKAGHAKPKRQRKTCIQPNQPDMFNSPEGDSFPVGAAAAAAVALDFRQNLSDE